jgi:hypothetical protein
MSHYRPSVPMIRHASDMNDKVLAFLKSPG